MSQTRAAAAGWEGADTNPLVNECGRSERRGIIIKGVILLYLLSLFSQIETSRKGLISHRL
jgi:hypothetical protein